MKKILLLSIFSIGFSTFTDAQVTITNSNSFKTADQMLLANELFESGEPFAEALGYNLDVLDPMIPNSPDELSYITGIESYEYSRYLLNTLNGRSGMGLHMMWSPVIQQMAAMQPASFDGSFTGGMINGYKEDDMLMMMIGNFGTNANMTPPANAFPQFADFMEADNNLPQAVAVNFAMDFSSTRWDRASMTKVLNLGAMGQSLWKQYYWAKDMLGAFHNGNDDGIDADGTNSPDLPGSPDFDPNNDIFYGGNTIDGFQGQVLTAVSINKTSFLISELAYDGTTLGAVNPATYDPANGIKYFPTQIGVTESTVLAGLPPQKASLTVLDATSQLFDQTSYLLGTASYRNMMDPNNNSDAAHLAYHEVFDGFPFPAAMSQTGTPGPYDLMSGTSKVIFQNMLAMHFNAAEGTFVDTATLNASGIPVMGTTISAINAGYTLVSLANFINEFSGTPLESMAIDALNSQANFIINNLKDTNGGFYNNFTLGNGASSNTKTLAANAALIRGLYAAYAVTNTTAFLTEANIGYSYLISNFYVSDEYAFKTELDNDVAAYNPFNIAIVVGALREAYLIGNQSGSEIIYKDFFQTVINKMLLTEAEVTGETGGDSDGDGIPYIAGGTKPFVFAAESTYVFSSLSTTEFNTNLKMALYPNPASDTFTIELSNQYSNSNIKTVIYDISGRVVFSKNAETTDTKLSILVSALTKGTYFVKVLSNNTTIGIEKFIKN